MQNLRLIAAIPLSVLRAPVTEGGRTRLLIQ